jgi:hypothetical protein
MRLGVVILGILVGGCASKPSQVVVTPPAAPIYDDAVAAALVYSPPVTADGPRLDLSREGRDQAAFAGFEDVIQTFYYLRMDDYQASYGRHSFNNDQFQREAITERVGVSYR